MCLICTEPLWSRSRSRNGDSGDWDRSHAGPCRFCSLIPTENWFKRWSLESHEVSITCQFCFLSSLCKPHHLHEATVELDPCYHSTRTQMPRWTRCSNLFQLVPTGSNLFQLAAVYVHYHHYHTCPKLCQVVPDEGVNIVHVQQEINSYIDACRSSRSGNKCKVIQNAGTPRSGESVLLGFSIQGFLIHLNAVNLSQCSHDDH